MSVLIRGMDMPCCCKECIMWNNESSLYGGCLAVSEREGIFDGKTNMEVRQPCCPLVPVPQHGRLIDADALYEHAKLRSERFNGCFNDLDNVINALYIETFPTIIPAEEGET